MNLQPHIIASLRLLAVQLYELFQKLLFFLQTALPQRRQLNLVLRQTLVEFRQKHFFQVLAGCRNNNDIHFMLGPSSHAPHQAGFDQLQQHSLVLHQGMGLVQKEHAPIGHFHKSRLVKGPCKGSFIGAEDFHSRNVRIGKLRAVHFDKGRALF